VIEIPLRQSWLNTLDRCPEQARQERLGLVTTLPNSDMLRGNLVHAAIEHCGNMMMEYGAIRCLEAAPTLDECMEYMDSVTAQLSSEVVEWREDYEKVIDRARVNLTGWYNDYLPKLGIPTGVEQEFRITLDERDGVRLVLTGTADWVEPNRITDWKNPGREYVQWEKRRWDLQSTVYCHALGIPSFALVAIVNGVVQETLIERPAGYGEALKDLCWSAAGLIQSDLKVWPMRWSGWHCSPKWCPVWQAGECRGKHLGSNPW